MPIPNPQAGESQDDFVSRCVSQIYDEYGEEQSVAICITKYNEMNSIKRKDEHKSVLSKMERFRKDAYKGINLNEDGEVNLEAPCWKNYKQYGTKIVDGKEVPNCVGPIEGVD